MSETFIPMVTTDSPETNMALFFAVHTEIERLQNERRGSENKADFDKHCQKIDRLLDISKALNTEYGGGNDLSSLTE